MKVANRVGDAGQPWQSPAPYGKKLDEVAQIWAQLSLSTAAYLAPSSPIAPPQDTLGNVVMILLQIQGTHVGLAQQTAGTRPRFLARVKDRSNVQ